MTASHSINLLPSVFPLLAGNWVEHTSGEMFKIGPKGAFVARNFSLQEMPLYSPPGAIITMRTLPSGSQAQGVLGLSSQVSLDFFCVFAESSSHARIHGSISSDVLHQCCLLDSFTALCFRRCPTT